MPHTMSSFTLEQSTAPASEPVSLTAAKLSLKVEVDLDDDVITRLIKGARRHAERITRRQLIDASFTLRLDSFPSVIVLPRPPLDSVTSIEYVDTNGDTQTLSASAYQVIDKDEPAQIVEAFNQQWPSTRDQREAVTIIYKAGYGTSSSSVPESAISAMMLHIAHRYEFRQPAIAGVDVKPIPMGIDDELADLEFGYSWNA